MDAGEVLPALSALRDTTEDPITIVEIGSNLGDCLLWAAALLGPRRLRAFGLEPAPPARERFQVSDTVRTPRRV